MKSRFTSLDVLAAVSDTSALITGAHLQNIYDVDYKTLLFKFSKRDCKTVLLVESGVRMHATDLVREDVKSMPSGFVGKLRKHLRDRRLTSMSQMEFDRIVMCEFGHDTNPGMIFRLYFEFYALGNVILTDRNNQILAISREVCNKQNEKVMAVGFIYEILTPLKFPVLGQVNPQSSIRNALKTVYPVVLVDHALSALGIDSSSKNIDPSPVIQEMDRVLQTIRSSNSIIGVLTRSDGHFISFDPFPFANITEKAEYESFSKAVDVYFHEIQAANAERAQKSKEQLMEKKRLAVQHEQQSRINGLLDQIDQYLAAAIFIEANIDLVEQVCLIIYTGLENELGWTELELLIKQEQSAGRELAQRIAGLKLEKSLVSIYKHDPNQSPSALALNEALNNIIDVDITLGGHANAQRYYHLRKVAIEKLERTRAAFDEAMKSAERKLRKDMSQSSDRKSSHTLIGKRKPMWFEKFNWFVSSDRFLVLCGHDMHQNEYLVKRVLRPGDAYIHADMAGASSVIVKNHLKTESDPSKMSIPHRTLVEAGAFSLCFSKAWEAKIVTSAWWVHAHQVSKTAPSGEYLTTGSFMIRGQKHFLPPSQLTLGFAFMFILDPDSTERHRIHCAQRRQLLSSQDGDTGDIGTQDIDDLGEKYKDYLAVSNDALGDVVITTESAPKPKAIKFQPKKTVDESKTKESKSKKSSTKYKKMNKKYKDQDDEERADRIALLQSAPKPSAPEIKPAAITQSKENTSSSLPKTAKNTTTTAPTVESTEDAPGLDELAIVDSLVGKLDSEMTPIHAICVAAPFQVTQHYQYRVKLLPGNLKRGTAAKLAVQTIMAECKNQMPTLHRDLIRAVPDSELNSTMPAHVRLGASGITLSKVKKDIKSKKTKNKA